MKGNTPLISGEKTTIEFYVEKFHPRVKLFDPIFWLAVVHMPWVDALSRVKSSNFTSQYNIYE